MTPCVVDTNVAVVANDKTPEASPDCVITCVDSLVDIQQSGVIVLDSGSLILKEYINNLSLSGQPGVGDAFMKWVWQVQADESRCESVDITPDANRGFAEFPDDPELVHFHDDDRKFVAVAVASLHSPEVLNAVDSDWWDHRQALERNGIRVRFICPDHFCDEE